ncbi:hypothetical protein DTL70_04485 [Streptomyces diacarni]|uniref:GH18 domain-containing protein n=1 Tax=Streptomyces diacarni TaxID=2800381 RepID=A0A367FB45_9ACTN|nr:hypothetical protein DTL70_04485 [Streptomyces diacarni]
MGTGAGARQSEGVEKAAGTAARERRRRRLGVRMPGRTRARRALAWTALALTVLLVLPVAAAASALRLAYTGDPQPEARTRGRDAIWLGHAWVDGRRDAGDLRALKRRMAGTGIRDLYVHTGPLAHDGSLPADRHPRAGWLLRAVEREMPGVRVQAWLGDRLVYGKDQRGGLRLADRGTRDAVVAGARQVLAAGFDGVHFDLEPLRSGDGDYLRLLERLRRSVHARGGMLSVAAHQIDPLPGLHQVGEATAGEGKWWSQGYFGQVAGRVDQIALMSYDTWLPVESLYGGYVARQTRLALQAAPDDVDVLMGLPFFHTDSMGHHAGAETVAAAVRGVRLGLGRQEPGRGRFGVALYVDFAATAKDWTAYRRGWCAPDGS